MYKAQIAYHTERLTYYQQKQAEYEAETENAQKYDAILSASGEDYPIPYNVGDSVTEGYWYACQHVKAQALQSGIPTGMTDTEYFDNMSTF